VASDEVEIHPEHLVACGTRIRSAAQVSHGLNVSVQQQLASYGQPWGDDAVGSLMGLCYQVVAGAASESFASNAAAMHDHGARLQAMARTWQQTEDSNAAKVNTISKAVG